MFAYENMFAQYMARDEAGSKPGSKKGCNVLLKMSQIGNSRPHCSCMSSYCERGTNDGKTSLEFVLNLYHKRQIEKDDHSSKSFQNHAIIDNLKSIFY